MSMTESTTTDRQVRAESRVDDALIRVDMELAKAREAVGILIDKVSGALRPDNADKAIPSDAVAMPVQSALTTRIDDLARSAGYIAKLALVAAVRVEL